jgi:tetratricopeptide (TPR) repeat protein
MSNSGRYFKFDNQALARLAQATSSTIAWLLIMPDVIGILPSAQSVVSYFLTLLGLWIQVAVLWFVSFWGILHLAGFVSRGVCLRADGIQLGRFSRLIPWRNIEAIAVEPQELFSRFFSLAEVARRLTIFETPRKKNRIFGDRLIAHNIPSFLFANAAFEDLLNAVDRQRFGFLPDSHNVLLFEPASLNKLRKVNGLMSAQRALVAVLIIFGLVGVLGRKAIVNYYYNYGNKLMSQNNFSLAKKRYKQALAFEPTFAAGWNNLGNAEFYLGDSEESRHHWRKALAFKPDYVEAKVSLAHLCLRERQFAEAKDFIDSALNIAPLNCFAMIKRADYNLTTGHFREANQDAREALAQMRVDRTQVPSASYMAVCLLADTKLKLGNPNSALALLSRLPADESLHDMEDVSFRLAIESQCRLALKQFSLAEKLGRSAFLSAPADPQMSINLAEILIACGKNAEAGSVIQRAKTLAPANPFCYLAGAELDLSTHRIREAKEELASAERLSPQDAQSLAKAAQIALALDDRELALSLARQSLKCEPLTSEARRILNELDGSADNLSRRW